MNLLLYIDPGTGSMLFSLVIGLVAASAFVFRALFLKIKFILSGGKAEASLDKKNIPLVIFSDHKRYWNVFKPICDELEHRKVEAVFYTASSDDPALTAGYSFVHAEYLGEGNKPYAKLNMLRADIVLATTPGLKVYQWKRSKNVKCYVHIPHTVDDLSGYRMFGLDYYDAVLTSGQNQVDVIREIERLRPAIKRKEIVTVGSPCMDALKLRTDSAPPIGRQEQRVVLVAPSWGASGILSRYGEKLLSALVCTSFKIVVRPHPQTVIQEQSVLDPLVRAFPQIEWNYDNDNFDILNRSDILITDFSGIIFDYSLVFGKPLIYADINFDTRPYDADWLSEQPTWIFRAMSKVGIPLKQEEFVRIEDVINSAIESPVLQEGREAVRSECWEHIGKSAELVVDWLLDKQKELGTLVIR